MEHTDARVAVLVDCDNVAPDIVSHALLMAAQFGRVVVRRGYGNAQTLAGKWQEALVRQAFTPCVQFQYASGKNTADIALALDALEVLFDERADIFCLVTSDSDFSYLCRKLRERGARVCIIGEPKTPDALRNASDEFFEWIKPVELPALAPVDSPPGVTKKAVKAAKAAPKAPARKRPPFVVDAVQLLAGSTADGRVQLSPLGHYLKRTDSSFSPKTFGYSGLLSMVKAYPELEPVQDSSGHWTVRLKAAGKSA
jgi:uncharacterized protein (TIGR00288 family)